MSVKDSQILRECPFCGGEARTSGGRERAFAVWCTNCGAGVNKPFEETAIAAWNSRADYHGYEQAAIDAWESIKAWNNRAERTCECIVEYAKSPIDAKTIVLHRCSSCNELMRPHMNYCPNCGRRCI